MRGGGGSADTGASCRGGSILTYCWSMFQKSSSAKEGLWNMVFTFFISI